MVGTSGKTSARSGVVTASARIFPLFANGAIADALTNTMGNMASRGGRDRRNLALKRRVHDVDVRGKPEHLGDHVVSGAGAGRSVGDFAGLPARDRSHLLDPFHRPLRLYSEHPPHR